MFIPENGVLKNSNTYFWIILYSLDSQQFIFFYLKIYKLSITIFVGIKIENDKPKIYLNRYNIVG